ncbi:hypothetical protein LXL04_026262 [Taraxacum kok-saghyz]
MNSLSLAPFSSSTLPKLKPLYTLHSHPYINVNLQNRRIRNGRCRAELMHNDAPFLVAIGSSVLNSLVFPLPGGPIEEDGDSMIDSAGARFAVMGIISFIPYLNWMSWVFAWMETGDKRYAIYAIVYLAPYLRFYKLLIIYFMKIPSSRICEPWLINMAIDCDYRTNLSLSLDESWLPIASIVLCILHIQLEASIKNASLKKDQRILEQGRRNDELNLPSSSGHELSDKIRGWGMPKKHARKVDHFDDN